MITLPGLARWLRDLSGLLDLTGYKHFLTKQKQKNVYLFSYSPPRAGEEILVSLAPLSHISSQIIDIYYIISVAGTTVFPGYERIHKDEKLWEVFSEVMKKSFKYNSDCYD